MQTEVLANLYSEMPTPFFLWTYFEICPSLQNVAYAMVYLIFTCICETRLFVYKNNIGNTFCQGNPPLYQSLLLKNGMTQNQPKPPETTQNQPFPPETG